MRVTIRRVGTQKPSPDWPAGWPPPAVGHEVGFPDGQLWKVHTVVWYPEGADDDPEPFCYVVLRAS